MKDLENFKTFGILEISRIAENSKKLGKIP